MVRHNLTPPDGGASWLTIWSRCGLVDFGDGPEFVESLNKLSGPFITLGSYQMSDTRSQTAGQTGDMIKLEIRSVILSSFSFGRDASNLTVSRLIPRNSRDVEGPSVFSTDKGTPSSLKTDVRVARPSAGGDEGEIIRKSSKR